MRRNVIRTRAGAAQPTNFLRDILDSQTLGVRPTAQQKIIRTNTKFGNPGIAEQQGTTYAIYDTLPLDGRTMFRFFEGVNTRTFPRTNISEPKLQVAESMTLQWMSLIVVVFTAGNILPVVSVNDIQTAALTSLYRSDFSFFIDNNRVIKPIPINLMQSKFNPWAKFLGNDIFLFSMQNDIIIPSLIQIVAQLQTTFATPTANTELMMVLGGTSAILAPKGTF